MKRLKKYIRKVKIKRGSIESRLYNGSSNPKLLDSVNSISAYTHGNTCVELINAVLRSEYACSRFVMFLRFLTICVRIYSISKHRINGSLPGRKPFNSIAGKARILYHSIIRVMDNIGSRAMVLYSKFIWVSDIKNFKLKGKFIMNKPLNNSKDLKGLTEEMLKSKKRYKADIILSKPEELPISELELMDMTTDTMKPAISVRAFGNLNANAAMLLIPRFKKYGYKGYSIDLRIPDTVSVLDKQKMQARLMRFCKEDKRSEFEAKMLAGATISVEEAVEFALIDKIIDPYASKRRDPRKGVTVASNTQENDASK